MMETKKLPCKKLFASTTGTMFTVTCLYMTWGIRRVGYAFNHFDEDNRCANDSNSPRVGVAA